MNDVSPTLRNKQTNKKKTEDKSNPKQAENRK